MTFGASTEEMDHPIVANGSTVCRPGLKTAVQGQRSDKAPRMLGLAQVDVEESSLIGGIPPFHLDGSSSVLFQRQNLPSLPRSGAFTDRRCLQISPLARRTDKCVRQTETETGSKLPVSTDQTTASCVGYFRTNINKKQLIQPVSVQWD